MNSQFKEGDVVQLKSGGFPMTILFRYGDEWVCQWFDANGELQSGPFADTALKIFAALSEDEARRQIGFSST